MAQCIFAVAMLLLPESPETFGLSRQDADPGSLLSVKMKDDVAERLRGGRADQPLLPSSTLDDAAAARLARCFRSLLRSVTIDELLSVVLKGNLH